MPSINLLFYFIIIIIIIFFFFWCLWLFMVVCGSMWWFVVVQFAVVTPSLLSCPALLNSCNFTDLKNWFNGLMNSFWVPERENIISSSRMILHTTVTTTIFPTVPLQTAIVGLFCYAWCWNIYVLCKDVSLHVVIIPEWNGWCPVVSSLILAHTLFRLYVLSETYNRHA